MTGAKAAALAILAALAGPLMAAPPLPSGSVFLSDPVRAQQDDPDANPGMLWVTEGERLWDEPAGETGLACAGCHDEAAASMRGVASRYPAFDAFTGTLQNLEGRINRCRTEHQRAPALAYESEPLLALTALVARQSLGLPMAVEVGGRAAPFYQRGAALFERRQGQLNLSCGHCHDDHAGQALRGDTISYGLGNGYPAYRLEWQALGSLHRRLRACYIGVRAEPPMAGSTDHLSVELYLARRAAGVVVETPAIRR